MVSAQQSKQVEKGKAKMVNLLQAQLEDASPSSMDIAHVIASSSGASSSNYMQPNTEDRPLNDTNMPTAVAKPKAKGRPKKIPQSVTDPMLIDKELKRSPEEEHEQKGKVGRPRKTPLSEEPDTMLVDNELKRLGTKMPDESPQKKKF